MAVVSTIFIVSLFTVAPAESVVVVVVVVVVVLFDGAAEVLVSDDGVVGAVVCPEVAVVSISVEGVFSLLQAEKTRPVARSAVNRNARVFMR